MARTQYSDPTTHWQSTEIKIVDGLPVRFSDVCVHEFFIGDVEDPDIYAAEPVWTWQRSELGQWVTTHVVGEIYWTRAADYASYGFRYRIMARLSEQNQTFFKLKWSKQ
jgi:hypothetical protein